MAVASDREWAKTTLPHFPMHVQVHSNINIQKVNPDACKLMGLNMMSSCMKHFIYIKSLMLYFYIIYQYLLYHSTISTNVVA